MTFEKKYKIKIMTLDEMTLAIDRLTRFKFPEIKYNRVFKEIISKYLIEPKISFKDYESLEAYDICKLVEEIFNKSIGKQREQDSFLQKKIVELEEKVFVIDGETKKLMSAKIPYEAILTNSKEKLYCKNLQFWSRFVNEKDVESVRNKYLTKFPIEKIILAEGITEEILLPKFSKILNYDFDKNGVEVLAAGGKNQVAKEYLKLRDRLKLPIVVLLDSDAKEVAQTISCKLRAQDKLILIEKGEFEDILPLELIVETINYKFLNIFSLDVEDFSVNESRVKELEEIYRVNGLGEFKKADFAHTIETVLNAPTKIFISEEIEEIINEIKAV